MSNLCFRALVSGFLALSPMAATAAEDLSSHCVDAALPKDAIAQSHGQWIQLTPEQWQFLRGIYVLNPTTPPGLPYGDKAVLARIEGNPGGLVIFIDGDKACTPMNIPRELVAMLQDVGTGTINHESGGL